MRKAVHKALSLFPEDVALLKELADRAGIKESSYVRLLLKREKALIDKKKGNFAECPLSGEEKTSDESEGPDEDGNLGAFSTEKLPRLSNFVKWQLYWDEKYQRKIWIRVAPIWEVYIEGMLNFLNKNHRFTMLNETMHNYETGNVQRINRRSYEID